LGSLGTIDDEYDVAVSTACGTLNFLVVDTVEEGQACIEYLRRQNIGRASFMVLEKLNSEGCAHIATPEDVPRLFDLIRPKESRFAAAFYKGVGNTLVAKDLDQANRIAFGGQKRWRVVTLAGHLIDASGTMSGGGTKVMKGGMSSKLASDAVDPAVLRRYEKDAEEANHQLEELLADIKVAEEQFDVLKAKKPVIDVELQKMELEVATLLKREIEANKRSKELRSVPHIVCMWWNVLMD
jgi:structural maintenance of chromosome 4